MINLAVEAKDNTAKTFWRAFVPGNGAKTGEKFGLNEYLDDENFRREMNNLLDAVLDNPEKDVFGDGNDVSI